MTSSIQEELGVDPHPEDENIEDCIGEVMPDPWDDETQTDWPNEEVSV